MRSHSAIQSGRRIQRLLAAVERLEERQLLSAAAEIPDAATTAGAWQSVHGDMWNTGRADYTIAASRLNNSLFDVFLWQKRVPGSPGEGNISSSAMVYYDGAGPGGADLVAGGYHWPKGVAGMNRHTGQLYWSGNPAGGERIGQNTAAFSNDGQTIYVTNDSTDSPEYPQGHPLMAFDAETGPSVYRHNGGDTEPGLMGAFSPIVGPDGRIFLHDWNGRPRAATDTGTALQRTWNAAVGISDCYSNPALYLDGDHLHVVGTGRGGRIAAFDGTTGNQLWSVNMGQFTDADPTVDPASGHIYLPVGSTSVYVVGLDKEGNSLWGTPTKRVFEYISGSNNAQFARSGGCLSLDGSTYYFQTVNPQGDGRLYAINTMDGSVKWSFQTAGQAGEQVCSSPIVTANGIIVIGNDAGRTYWAIQDVGTSGQLIDSVVVDVAGTASASATMSSDGVLYLPMRLVQSAGAAGETPSGAVENLFCALDVSESASPTLYPPANQRALALNHAARLRWTPILDTTGNFGHYAIYRETAPFTSVAGKTPIATVTPVSSDTYTDSTAQNGTTYYYAITTVTLSGGEMEEVASIGPRTPRDESDLQMVSISRTPQYPRYDAVYSGYERSEPSGFGPYTFSGSTGLGSGQTVETQRFPELGDPVTYTAMVRNRGTNTWSGNLSGQWLLDDIVVASPSQPVTLAPGETATFTYVLNWDNQPHALSFAFSEPDARPANNQLTSDTLAVPFLTYVDQSFIEQFREQWSLEHAGVVTDDMIDWLNRHMERFNEMFADAGSRKRVAYDVLQVLDDTAADPAIDRSPYAIFPFRYHSEGDADPRLSGYWHSEDDIDYGLLHEMGHQLGLIDIYQLNVEANQNQVSGQGYSAVPCLMNGCSTFLSEHSKLAMDHWLNEAHGYFGQYLYNLPETLSVRILGYDGEPLNGATVKVYQYCDRPGQGKVITSQIKAQGTTDSDGVYTLPNVPIDPSLIPQIGTGDELRPNPFGYVACIGSNGVLLLRIEYAGGIDYAWLDITEANVAYWKGQTVSATFDRQVPLGGPVQHRPPIDMTENNAADWTCWVQGGAGTLANDTAQKVIGASSVKFITDGGYDNYIRYPARYTANWNLSAASNLNVRMRADNPNPGFQEGSPWIRLKDAEGGYFEYRYYRDGHPEDLLNEARGQWQTWQVPLNAPENPTNGWGRAVHGAPSLTSINAIEIHADTWGFGYTLWVDGLGFDLPQPGGNVLLGGSSGKDSYTVRLDPGQQYVEIFENAPPDGSPNYRIPRTGLDSLTIACGAGDDVVTIDASNGSPLSAGQFFLSPGDGADALNLNGGAVTLASDTFTSAAGLALRINDAVAHVSGDLTLREISFTGAARLTLDYATGPGNMLRLYPAGTAPGATPTAQQVQSVWAAVRSAYSSGPWTGPGLAASTIANAAINGVGLILGTDAQGAQYIGVREMILGDVNGDDKVTIGDVMVALNSANYQQDGTWLNGDVNYDGKVTIGDVMLMLNSTRYQQDYNPSNAPVTAEPAPAPAPAALPVTDSQSVGGTEPTSAADAVRPHTVPVKRPTSPAVKMAWASKPNRAGNPHPILQPLQGSRFGIGHAFSNRRIVGERGVYDDTRSILQ